MNIVDSPESSTPVELKGQTGKNQFFTNDPDGRQLTEISGVVNNGTCGTMMAAIGWDLQDCGEAVAKLKGAIIAERL